MKTKTKVISLLIVVALLVSTLIVGVLAVINTDFAVTGNIKFKATGVEATISCTGLENGTLNNGIVGQDKLTDITIDTSKSQADLYDTFSPWQSLSLSFGSDASDILLKLRITNDNADSNNCISADVSVDAGESYNCSITALNDADNSSTAFITPGNYADYTISFSVLDKETSVNISDFVVNFNLQMMEVLSFSSYTETLTITCDEENRTASVKASNLNITSAEIPTYVRSANNYVCTINNIEDSGFSGCASLTNISIPSTIETIGNDVFTNCPLNTTSYSNANYLGNSQNPYLVLYTALSSASSITIHVDCRVIYSNALSDCDKITNIKIPVNIKSIGDSAFYGLFLKNIYIDSSYIASALSGKTADICGGLLRYFENLWIRTSVYDFLNAYVINTFKAGDYIDIGEREYYLYTSGSTIY